MTSQTEDLSVYIQTVIAKFELTGYSGISSKVQGLQIAGVRGKILNTCYICFFFKDLLLHVSIL